MWLEIGRWVRQASQNLAVTCENVSLANYMLALCGKDP